MKIFLIIVLIFLIMLIATAVSQQYRDKYDFYLNLKNLLLKFKMNVTFKKEKILNFLNQQNGKKEFKLFIEDYKEYLTTNKINLENIKLLDADEKTTLMSILKQLGNYDTENEIQQLQNFINVIEEKLLKAKEETQKLCPMIIKLSLLFAIGLAIILVWGEYGNYI